ncbi:Golgi complex component 7-domain-containing protein [Flagelloscypha sp. PMI_526]|nr:Golgi complex component 7-domain-containing protein [Flagelloscypha sp. PMI_526]
MSLDLPASTSELLESLEDYDDVITWINDTLSPPTIDATQPSLTDLDQQLTRLLATLDIACEDTSSELERIIDDVSRGVPRLTYDLHFMKDSAVTLQGSLARVLVQSKSAINDPTSAAMERLRTLDVIKRNMEAARDVLREAESWSSLEMEVTALLAEHSYSKAAERLSEANKSMAVFQNTPEYDPRRQLMVNLQNQLEASLSSALVQAINAQDMPSCRIYYGIFSQIERESEFRNYYHGSRRAGLVTLWQEASLPDCGESPPGTGSFQEFLPKFYANFLALLNQERGSIPTIFPDPLQSLSNFITSVYTSLQPSLPQRLAGFVSHHGTGALPALIKLFQATEEFAQNVQKIFEKLQYSSLASPGLDFPPTPSADSFQTKSHPSAVQSNVNVLAAWGTEVFSPFLQYQTEYGDLERRFFENALQTIVTSESSLSESDPARLMRERSVDVVSAAESSLSRCTMFTYGFASSFIDMWTADVSLSTSVPSAASTSFDDELSDLDYNAQDMASFGLTLHLLSSGASYRMDPENAGQSSGKATGLNASSTTPLLSQARSSMFNFARTCQVSLQETILSPVREHLVGYSSSSSWVAPGDPRSRTTVLGNDLHVPSFSLSPTEAMQRVGEGLLNLPRLFETNTKDSALFFSLHTLPHIDDELIKDLVDQQQQPSSTDSSQHILRSSITKSSVQTTLVPEMLDPETVSSVWLASLGHTFLVHLTNDVLPSIQRLTPAGAAQLASDLDYLSKIVAALNVQSDVLEKWSLFVSLEEGGDMQEQGDIWEIVKRMRGWR